MTGSYSLWDYDVTVRRSGEPSVFGYLYGLSADFSCKAGAWMVGQRQSSDLGQRLWDQGLANEARLNLLTATQVHTGRAASLLAVRQIVRPSRSPSQFEPRTNHTGRTHRPNLTRCPPLRGLLLGGA